jgi:hypothetical protein
VSAGAVFQEALRSVRALALPEVAELDVVATLEAHRQALTFFAEAAWEAHDDPSAARRRAAAIFVAQAAGNLADDLMDGEATHLPDPQRLGPGAQWTLQHLGTMLLLESGVGASTLAQASMELARTGGWAQVECRDPVWDAALYRDYVRAAAALQTTAWLRMMWDGTRLAPEAPRLAHDLGILSIIGADAAEQKPRWRALPSAARNEALEWTRRLAADHAESPYACARLVVRSVRRLLDAPPAPGHHPEI